MSKRRITVQDEFSRSEPGPERLEFVDKQTKLSCAFLEWRFHTRWAPEKIFVHAHTAFSRLYMFEKGGAALEVGGKKLELKPGHAYLIPDGLSYTVCYREDAALLTSHFHLSDFSGMSIFRDLSRVVAIDNRVIVSETHRCHVAGDVFGRAWSMMGLLRKVIAERWEFIQDRTVKLREFKQVFDAIAAQPVGCVTIKELADIHGVTSCALSRRFRRKLGFELKSYLHDETMRQAHDLLLHTSLTVNEIAARLGMGTSQYFHRYFKRHGGVTPAEYRRMHTNPSGQATP